MSTDRLQMLDVVAQFSAIFNNTRLDFTTKLDRVLHKTLDLLEAEAGSIMLIKGQNLVVAAASRPELIGCKQSLTSDAPSAWVVRSKKPLYVSKDSRPGDISTRPQAYTKQAFVLAPIMSGAKVLGVMSVTERLNADCFTPDEQEALVRIASFLIGSLERERLAKQLKRNQQELKRKNARLERLEDLRTQLFNMLIHDLKGPLSEIVANLDILSYMVAPEQLEFVRAGQSGCDSLYRMIADLMDVTRLEEGQLPLLPERFDPAEIITEAADRIKGSAAARGISLNYELNPASPWLTADRNLLVRVLQNLLLNAIHHSPENQAVQISYGEIEPGSLTITVSDQGPGVPPHMQTAIFDKFVQVEHRGLVRKSSAGLGLAFCKLAIEAHGGRIWVESDGVNGSVFNFRLPLLSPSAKEDKLP
ncbi:MAG: Sensor histidine kinase TmoS [Deltaproteobacteria bacterium ADurb.Bin510]|nr:MAG: Sensor histidine kinase TmoS [Deltaproteobacteria bacterium ADurb.Bin510]